MSDPINDILHRQRVGVAKTPMAAGVPAAPIAAPAQIPLGAVPGRQSLRRMPEWAELMATHAPSVAAGDGSCILGQERPQPGAAHAGSERFQFPEAAGFGPARRGAGAAPGADLTQTLKELIAELKNARPPAGVPQAPTPASHAKPKRRKRKASTEPHPLTEKQNQAVGLYGELQGDFDKIGDRMGISRQAARKHVEKGLAKLERKILPKPKTKSIPTDERGNDTLADFDSRMKPTMRTKE
jgi:hypothetical protein